MGLHDPPCRCSKIDTLSRLEIYVCLPRFAFEELALGASVPIEITALSTVYMYSPMEHRVDHEALVLKAKEGNVEQKQKDNPDTRPANAIVKTRSTE